MPDTEELIFFALIGLGALGLIIVLKTLFSGGKKKIGVESFSYSARHLLTSNENAFFHALKHLCDERGLFISCKCRLEDVVRAETQEGRYPLRNRHVDFILYDQNGMIIAGIELDDSSHKGREDLDAIRDRVFECAGIPLYHFNSVRDGYTPKEIRDKLFSD